MALQQKKDRRKITHDWKGLISSNFVTLIGAYLLFLSTQGSTQSQALTAAYTQIDSQGQQIIELRGLILQQQLQIVDLVAELKENVDTNQMIITVFDSLPFPAWIKKYDEKNDRFTMFMVNQAYTAEYGITNKEYEGKTDYQVHTADLAREYEAADRAVLESDRPDKRPQQLKKANGEVVELMVYKFSLRLNGNKIGIGGVSIHRGIF